MQVTKFLKFKELFLFLFIIALCTGCTSEIYYNFGENDIESKITIKYNVDEYTKYVNDTDEDLMINRKYTNYQVKTGSEKLFNENKINSFANVDTYKYSGKLTQNNDNFIYEYTYKYKYNDFKNNNIFNNYVITDKENHEYELKETRIVITYYIEGWDKDNTDLVCEGNFLSNLVFEADYARSDIYS